MKKIIIFIMFCIFILPACASVDKFSKEYLQSNRHFSPINPFVEMAVEHQIKSSLKKQTGGKYKVKFEGYTTESMKKGIFKTLDVTGKNIQDNDVTIPYVRFKSISDYNYIDYTKNPMVFKSNMSFMYELHLDEVSLNSALKSKNYNSTIAAVNRFLYPFLVVNDVKTTIDDNKLYVVMYYNVPTVRFRTDKTFIMTADFYVENGKIKPKNVKIENYHVKIPLNKITSILNILNPLDFTLDLLDSNKCKANIENVNIIDNVVVVNGRIFIKGE